MTDQRKDTTSAQQLPTDVPFETPPLLASNPDFAQKAERLRELKLTKDRFFTDKKDAQGVPIGEFDRLRLELGAMTSAAGVGSVTYIDLRISNTRATTAGEPGSGSVDGERLVGNLPHDREAPLVAYIQLLERILSTAVRSFDEDALIEAGVPPHVIVQSRGVGKGRSATTRVEWVGKHGPGADAKQGSSGTVQ